MMSYAIPASAPEETRGRVTLNSSTWSSLYKGPFLVSLHASQKQGFFVFFVFFRAFLFTYVGLSVEYKGTQYWDLCIGSNVAVDVSNECQLI